MSELKGQEGELRMTLTITRKDTGKVETVEFVGTVTEKEQDDGSHAQHSGS